MAVVALALLGFACGTDDGGGTIRGSGSPGPAEPARAREISPSNQAFATDLYRALAAAEPGDNLVLSPWLLHDQLGQVRTGATGVSLEELDAVLAIEGMPDEALLAGLHGVRGGVGSRAGEQTSDERSGTIVLDHESVLWLQRGTRFDGMWLDGLASGMDVGIRSIDFRSDPSTAETVVEQHLVEAHPDAALPDRLVTTDTRLLLASALRFEAPWARPFPASRTRDADFTLQDGTTVAVPTMRITAPRGLKVGGDDRRTAVAIPFLGGDLELIVVWPTTGTLDEMDAAMDREVLAQLIRSLRARPVTLHLPRFAVEETVRFDDALRATGLVATLDVETSELNAMAPGEPLSISAAVGTTSLVVDEEGTGRSAATATDPAVPDGSLAYQDVAVDRPFLFLVHDRDTNAVVQIGRITDPRRR